MADEQDWTRDRADFVANAHDAEHRIGSHGPSPLAAAFSQLTRMLLDAATTADVLEQVVPAALRIVSGADLVSITLRSADGSFHTPVETDPVAGELDQVQYDTGEGPCVAAARSSGPGHVYCDDLAHAPAWPKFGAAAVERGFKAVLSTVLLPDVQLPLLSGALNIYARRPRAFDAAAADIALLLATHASLALSGTQAVELAALREEQLRHAIDSRDVIGQAKGILMNRRGIDADEAFDTLRRTSQDLNVKLVELARTLATRHRELDLPPGRAQR